MYDIKHLEEQWSRYNKKRRKPFYMWSILVFSIIGLSTFIFLNKEFILSEIETLSKIETIEKTVSEESLNTVFLDESIKILAQKSEFINPKPIRKVISNNNPMDTSDVFIDTKQVDNRSDIEVDTKAKKKMHLEIIAMSGESTYKDVKNRFSLAPDPDDSIFLARNYYKDGNYEEAAHWALQTNKLNGDIEESWLIFAKSKAKTGQKNEAIRVLTMYVKKSGSFKAEKLLQKLKSN